MADPTDPARTPDKTTSPPTILVDGDFVQDIHIYEGKRRRYGDVAEGIHVVKERGGAGLLHKLLSVLQRMQAIEKNKPLVDRIRGCFDRLVQAMPKTPFDELGPKDRSALLDAIGDREKSRASRVIATHIMELPIARVEGALGDCEIFQLLVRLSQRTEFISQLRDEVREESIALSRKVREVFIPCEIQDLELEEEPPQHQKSFAYWTPCENVREKGQAKYWRVTKEMGFGSIADVNAGPWERSDKKDADQFDIVVISDGGMGIRNPELMPRLKLEKADSIFLKTTEPLLQGALWDQFTSQPELFDKLTVLVSADHLRRASVGISKGMSWDATLRDTLNALRADDFEELMRAHRVVVYFGTEASLWMEQQEDGWSVKFVYDPYAVEGEHAVEFAGTAFGISSCFAAAIVDYVYVRKIIPEQAMEAGLSAMYDLQSKGHGNVETGLPSGFPTDRLATEIDNPSKRYSRFSMKLPYSDRGEIATNWSIFDASLSQQMGDVHDLAKLVVTKGPVALDNLPQFKIGHLLSIDPAEVEVLRTIKRLVQQYQKKPKADTPLSLGVFGPPGSGKSFAVKQISNALLGEDCWLEFNLSQFDGPKDLIGAFHQVRDKVLQGDVPVAFFDEFDSQRLKWLQYLLAPMQDGLFQEGQITHPIGKCIFIFAGGTSWTFESFGPPDFADQQEFKAAKGPDFKSRLDAFLNVIGPNQKMSLGFNTEQKQYFPSNVDAADNFFPVRRALMMRAELKCKPAETVDMDEGVLHALIHAEKFSHGSRSLKKMMESFSSRGAKIFKSELPSMTTVQMHTDAGNFQKLLGYKSSFSASESLDETEASELARSIHQQYLQKGDKEGWLKPEDNIDFDKLSEFLQESNREAAKRIPRVLGLLGYEVLKVEGRERKNSSVELEMIGRAIELHIELLAREEHDLWMEWHKSKGWIYGPERNNPKQIHPLLKPYSELSDRDRSKDRDQVRGYPAQLRDVGYKIHKSKQHA